MQGHVVAQGASTDVRNKKTDQVLIFCTWPHTRRMGILWMGTGRGLKFSSVMHIFLILLLELAYKTRMP